MVAWVTFLMINDDVAGVLWPGFTPGILMSLGLGLAGLGLLGRRRCRQGASVASRCLALGVREVNYRGKSLFFPNKRKGGRA